MQSKHLTLEQREAFRKLFDVVDLVEALRCVAGIVAHDVESYAAAIDASDLIFKASQLVAQSKKG